MLLKYFYDEALAHASYLVGCQKSGEAVVIDPIEHIKQVKDTTLAMLLAASRRGSLTHQLKSG